jgi:hypothetical protein
MASKTLTEFRRSHKISKAKYYGLKRKGRGPREMRDNAFIRISDEAERDWQRELERARADSDTTTTT